MAMDYLGVCDDSYTFSYALVTKVIPLALWVNVVLCQQVFHQHLVLYRFIQM